MHATPASDHRLRRELVFLLALWKANLLSIMEYRIPFITQTLGMMLNNAVYFLFWVLFFGRFKEVRGWGLSDVFLMFGIVAASVGFTNFLFGNFMTLSETITTGRLDYYLSLPRPVLLHLLSSRSYAHGAGDLLYGILSFFIAGQLTLDAFARFLLGFLLAVTIYLSFMILVHSLSFWLGNTQMLSTQVLNALITFSIYPISLFEGSARFILFTLFPAALIGAVPAQLVRSFSWQNLAQLLAGGIIFLFLAIFTFHRGLRRYESGSAMQVQM